MSMSEKTSGRQLSIKRTGGGLLTLLPAGIGGVNPGPLLIPDPAQEVAIAGWQTAEHGVPHRCVVRCDGWIQQVIGNLASGNPGFQSEHGFPCGVLRVDYSIGGYQRSVMVECINQSALVVWAESIEVTKLWNRPRFDTLQEWFTVTGDDFPGMCINQRVAAAISLDDRGGDTGEADARYWDIIPFNNTEASASDASYLFEIPAGARALRLLDGSDNGVLIPFDTYLTGIGWATTAKPAALVTAGPMGILYQDKVPTDSCALEVPPNATHLILAYTPVAEGPMPTLPFLIEWVLAPAYK